MKRKFLALLMVILLVIPSIEGLSSTIANSRTSAVLNEKGFNYTVWNGSAAVSGYTGTGGAVVIPSTLGNYSVTAIWESAFENKNKITSITIPDGVKTIDRYAFKACTGLTKITFGSGLTTIGGEVFDGCTSLTSVDLPSNLNEIESKAFLGCFKMTQINVSASNTTFASISGVLFNKSLSTILQYPKGKTGEYSVPSSVTKIGEFAFYQCKGLTGINMGLGVSYIDFAAFNACTGLVSVTIPSSISDIVDNAFYGCSKLVAAIFQGNAPIRAGGNIFTACAPTFRIYYSSGKTGFGSTWKGYSTSTETYVPPAPSPTPTITPNTDSTGNKAVISVKISKTTLTISKGKTAKLTAIISPSNATNKSLTWKSSNSKIATVSSSGTVKGISKGSAYIYVYTVDGNKSAKCKVTVK